MAPKRLARAMPPPAETVDDETSFGKEEEKEEEESSDPERKVPDSARPTPADFEEEEEEEEQSSDSDQRNLKRTWSETGAALEHAAKTSSKKPKKAVSGTFFQRIWSEEDEITFLEGMLEYREKRGVDPALNVNSVYEFIKEKLQFDVAPAQLKNKIKNLKKKFLKNTAKDGKERSFTKPSEQKGFLLRKKLWGSDKGLIKETHMSKANAHGSALKKNKSAGKIAEVEDVNVSEKVDGGATFAELSRSSDDHFDNEFWSRGLDMISPSKRGEWEEGWKKLKLAELGLMSQRHLMIHEQTTFILDAYKKSRV